MCLSPLTLPSSTRPAGLFGTRAARALSRQQRQHARLLAQGRAPPVPFFPAGLFSTAVKLVRVLGPPGGYGEGDATASGEGRGRALDESSRAAGPRGLSLGEAAQRVGDALGGDAARIGADRQAAQGAGRHEERQRRRLKRAESGLRAWEIGAEVGRRVAGRLERHRSRRDATGGSEEGGDEQPGLTTKADGRFLTAVTPAALLGSPPSDPGLAAPSSSLNALKEPEDVPLRPPSAPALGPVSNPDLPPLPTVSTPLALEPSALDDYFGILRRRSSARRAPGSSASVSTRANFLASSSPRSPFVLRTVPPRRPTTVTRRLVDSAIYLLIGSPPAPSSAGLDTSLASVGGLVGLVVHTVGFAFFVAYHLSALVVASWGALRATGTFVYWLGMNLSGRTEVARAVGEYWRTGRAEWDRVVEEEGEEPLGMWSVARGLAELAMLQSSASRPSSSRRTVDSTTHSLGVFSSDARAVAQRRTRTTGPAQRRRDRRRRPQDAALWPSATQAELRR